MGGIGGGGGSEIPNDPWSNKISVVGSWEAQNANTEHGLLEVWKFFCKSLQ